MNMTKKKKKKTKKTEEEEEEEKSICYETNTIATNDKRRTI